MSLAEQISLSVTMLLTGFTIVFAVLFLLIFIIWAYGKVITSVMNKSNEKKAAKQKAEAEKAKAQSTVESKKVVAKATKPVASNGVTDDVVAVISAAVYSMYGSTDKVKIKSIKKSSGRNAWANAGVINNTRPF